MTTTPFVPWHTERSQEGTGSPQSTALPVLPACPRCRLASREVCTKIRNLLAGEKVTRSISTAAATATITSTRAEIRGAKVQEIGIRFAFRPSIAIDFETKRRTYRRRKKKVEKEETNRRSKISSPGESRTRDTDALTV